MADDRAEQGKHQENDADRAAPAALASFEALMKAGRDAAKQFEQALSNAQAQQNSLLAQWEKLHPFGKVMEAQRRYFTDMTQLWQRTFLGPMLGETSSADSETQAKGPADRRFSSKEWQQQPYYHLLRQSYLANAKLLNDLVEHAAVDDRTRLQLKFYARQFTDAMSPSNFPATNPDVIRTAIETRSQSLSDGMRNLIDDLQKGRITRVDETKFEVGGNLANTPGTVVFENDLIQLIEYAPVTAEVESLPLLMVPPCINKYYLLDLGKGNSFVEYAVAQGFRVFLVSWKSADASTEKFNWNDYLEKGPLAALDAVLDISGEARAHLLGFCVGGTIVGCAAGVLAERGEDKLASITLLTTMLDFSDTGEIGLIIDEPYVRLREATIGHGGILPGKELAFTFGTLRANDLIWRYVVDSYLKGATPDAFDLLYWDSDSVSLPGPMYCWYTRNTYLENNLKKPGQTLQCGVPVDFSHVKAPLYILASREDHIVPWRSAYATRGLMGGPSRFVLAASGHVAGVINPPARNKRSHWLSDLGSTDAEAWLAAAQENAGSWWPDWDRWMKSLSTGRRQAPQHPGNDRYHAIEPAPGRYVKEKAN